MELEQIAVKGTDYDLRDSRITGIDDSPTENSTNVVKSGGIKTYIDTETDKKVDKVTGKGLSSNDFTTAEKNKLSGIASNAQVNVLEGVKVDGTELPITNKTVNLPAYPTTLPASDVYDWAKASTKPSYNFGEIGGTVADSQLPDTITDLTVDGTLSGNAFQVIAEHIAKLTSRVEALEAGVGTVDTLSSTSVDSANGYYINGDKTVLNGAGAPSMVPGFIGQFYVDTTNKKLYVATGNSSSSNWTLLN